MNGTEFFIMILGMTLVTCLPRMLPAVLVGKLKYGRKIEKFLRLIPYTAMAALIFPGVFTVDVNPIIGIVGGAAAFVLAYFRMPVMVCVLGAIAADFVLYLVV